MSAIGIKIYKSGTMRFWDDWFGGRPMDNYHEVVNAYYDDKAEMIVINFDDDEVCKVFLPSDIVSEENVFHIEDAKCVEWSWFLYGKEKTEENLRHIKYTKIDEQTVECINDNSCKHINTTGLYAVEIC